METNNINLIHRKNCCGCEACANTCLLKLIQMKCDNAGFFYPQIIDVDKCTNCGVCLKVCPAFKSNIPSKLKYRRQCVYLWIKDNKELLSVSSGGLATYLYKRFLEEGAYIVGVEYNENYTEAQYVITQEYNKIERFKGSKYIQARKHNIYHDVKSVLDNGNNVFFIGLPCEVAAMKLVADSDNLYTCDLICHGPTSTEFLYRYITHLEKKQGARVISYTCRYKNPHWKPVNSRIVYSDGTEQIQVFATTELGKAFQMVKRYSCYHCKYKNGVTAADLTIGDYHAASMERGNYNIDGVSICFVNTQKGKALVQRALEDEEVVTGVASYEIAMANRALVESLPKLPGRKRFIRIMKKSGIDAACRDIFIATVLKYRSFPYRIRMYIRKLFQVCFGEK